MPLKSKATLIPESRLRSHLKEMLDDLPNTLPKYDEARFLDDLTFLLRSPLFLYAIAPRLVTRPAPLESYLPPTPVSISSKTCIDDTAIFDITRLEIRIRWTDNSWAAQLAYNDNVLLEGRQIGVEQEEGFVQCFFWFVEEASFLAWEYKAREGVLVEQHDMDEERTWTMGRAKTRDGAGRRSLKLKIRLEDTARGRAGVWRVW